MFSNQEREFMTRYIREYAPYEASIEDWAPLDHVLRFWREAKNNYLFRMFGGNLILEREIEYEATPTELLRSTEICSAYDFSFYQNLHDLCYRNAAYNDYADFWRPQPFAETGLYVTPCSYLLNLETLIHNNWELPDMYLPLPEGKKFKVCKGTRITRILSRLANAWGIDGIKDVLDWHSTVSTGRKIKGTLCLSIHPLDYMTMSDNDENWDSCMNWMDCGGYRAGTVEMMNSPCVVVAYLKHPTHKLMRFWNSKTWRNLFIVDRNLITGIKGYPFQQEYLDKYVGNWLRELAEKAHVNYYCATPQCYCRNLEDSFFRKNKINLYFYTNAMYNDTGRVAQWVYLNAEAEKGKRYEISYSGVRICMCCGEPENVTHFNGEDKLVCSECANEFFAVCANCGERLDEDEAYHVGDDYYCWSCWDDIACVPYDSYGEARYREDCVEVYLKTPDGEFNDCYVWFTRDCDPNDYSSQKYWEIEDGKRYLTFESIADDTNLLYEFGLTRRDIVKYRYYHKGPEAVEAALKEYDTSYRYPF